MHPTPSGTRIFLRQARENFLHTGAIAPSSRFLARCVARPLKEARGPVRVLEAGAGTGAITVQILRWLPPGSRLDIYEVNPVFARHLRRHFESTPHVRVHQARVEDLPAGAVYDAIFSGLPFNNFRPGDVRRILEVLFDALRPGGTMTWFEYLFLRRIRSMALAGPERRRLRGVGRLTKDYLSRYAVRRKAVIMNLPPALVHSIRKPPEPATPHPLPGGSPASP